MIIIVLMSTCKLIVIFGTDFVLVIVYRIEFTLLFITRERKETNFRTMKTQQLTANRFTNNRRSSLKGSSSKLEGVVRIILLIFALVTGWGFTSKAQIIYFGDDSSSPTVCSCLDNATQSGDGQFLDLITIESQPNETWTISSVSGFYDSGSAAPPASPIAFSVGDPFPEGPSGVYQLEGILVDSEQLNLEVSNGDTSLTINTTCYYPNPVIIGVPDEVCITSEVFPLEADVDGAAGTGEFRIDGNIAMEFDAYTLGEGMHTIEYTFDAGIAVPDSSSNPGCTQTVSKQVEVMSFDGIAVNDLVRVPFGPDCEATITPDMVLEGTYPCVNTDYIVTVFAPDNLTPIGNVIPVEYSGYTLMVVVTTANGRYTGMGEIAFELGTDPVIDCPDDTDEVTIEHDVYMLENTIDNNDPMITPANYSCMDNAVGNNIGVHRYQIDTIRVTRDDIYVFEGVGDFGAIGGMMYEEVFSTYLGPCINYMAVSEPLDAGMGYYTNRNDAVRMAVRMHPGMTYLLLTLGREPAQLGDFQWAVYSLNGGTIQGLNAHQTSDLMFPLYCEGEAFILNNTGSLMYTGEADDSGNCLPLEITFEDQFIQNGDCGSRSIRRTFTGVDIEGDEVECTQEISFQMLNLDDVTLPPKVYTVECDNNMVLNEDGNPDPEVAGYPFILTAFGAEPINPVYCNILSSYSDEDPIDLCGDTYQFIRNWFIIDDCTNQYMRYEQLVRIGDFTPPTVECTAPDENNDGQPDTLYFSSSGFSCDAILEIPTIIATDNCSAPENLEVTYQIVTDVPEYLTSAFGVVYDTIYVPEVIYTHPAGNTNLVVSGIPPGCHRFRYTVEDECGRMTVIECPFCVVDEIQPVAVCDDDLNVALGGDGYGRVYAIDIDEGSSDNCGEIVLMEARRLYEMDANCDPLSDPYYSDWSEYVEFSCCDVGQTITVQLRVTDASGLTNTCTTGILVMENVHPTCVAPQDMLITCTDLPIGFNRDSIADLQAVFGMPSGEDNCGVMDIIELDPVSDFDNCGSGTIVRTFQTIDAYGNLSEGTCQQHITVTGESSYSIKFPPHLSTTCSEPFPEDIEVFSRGCEDLFVGVEEEIYSTTQNACFQIVRTYYVKDFCQYNGVDDPVVITADPDCNGIPGEANVWLVKDGPLMRVDANNDTSDNFPAANTRGTSCDGYSNPSGYWMDVPSTGFWQYTQVIMVTDDTDPVVNVTMPQPFCSDAVDCTGSINIPFSVEELCSTENMDVNIFIDANNDGTFESNVTNSTLSGVYPNYTITGTFAIGLHSLEIRVMDGCGNQAIREVPFQVVDCLAPAPVCRNGIAVVLQELPANTDADGDGDIDPAGAIVSADDFLVNANLTDCTGPVRYSLHFTADVLNGTDVPEPDAENLVVTCDDDGAQIVRLYAWDSAFNPYAVQPDGTIGGPNYDYCETFLSVQDPSNACVIATATTAAIEGSVYTEDDEPVSNVYLNMNTTMPQDPMTEDDGHYMIDELDMGGAYEVTPHRNDDFTNGVSTLDIILITKHILGISTLDSPYKMIAADINKSGSISTFDIILLRKLILGINSDFGSNTSWRFIDANFEFPNPTNPWETNFPESLDVNYLDDHLSNQDFIAVKIGDVNGNARVNLSAPTGRQSLKTYFVNVPAQDLKAGQEYRIDFTAGQAEGLKGLQFALEFDRSAIELLDIEYAAAEVGNFNSDEKDNGLIRFSYDYAANGTLEPETKLFSLVFLAGRSGVISDMLSLNSRGTANEAYLFSEDLYDEFEVMEVALNFTQVEAQYKDGFVLYQNIPNPFEDRTSIPFELPEDSQAVLTVFDASGREWKRIEDWYAAGYNKIELDLSDIPVTGIMYYKLETKEWAATKKMIRFDR